MIEKITDWRNYLSDDSDDKKSNLFIECVDTGRPLGDENFVKKLEVVIGRVLRRQKQGPKKNGN